MAALSNSIPVPAIDRRPGTGAFPICRSAFVGAKALGPIASGQMITRARLDAAIEALIALADALDGDADIEASAIETHGRGFPPSLLIDEGEDDREGDEALQIDSFNVRNHGRIIR